VFAFGFKSERDVFAVSSIYLAMKYLFGALHVAVYSNHNAFLKTQKYEVHTVSVSEYGMQYFRFRMFDP